MSDCLLMTDIIVQKETIGYRRFDTNTQLIGKDCLEQKYAAACLAFAKRFMRKRVETTIGLASDDVRKPSNAWQRGKLVLNKDCVPYKSMLGEKSLAVRSSLFFRREVWKVLTTLSQLCASHIKRFRRSDKWGAVFRSIDDFPACFCMGRCLCLEPILPVATPVAALWRSTCKPYWRFFSEKLKFWALFSAGRVDPSQRNSTRSSTFSRVVIAAVVIPFVVVITVAALVAAIAVKAKRQKLASPLYLWRTTRKGTAKEKFECLERRWTQQPKQLLALFDVGRSRSRCAVQLWNKLDFVIWVIWFSGLFRKIAFNTAQAYMRNASCSPSKTPSQHCEG